MYLKNLHIKIACNTENYLHAKPMKGNWKRYFDILYKVYTLSEEEHQVKGIEIGVYIMLLFRA